MATSKQLHLLATKPGALARYQMTGKLPEGVRPASPLITLLEGIDPRRRAAIRGVTVDARLGYAGSRTFATAEQALLWAKPSNEVFDAFPADSWRIKAFSKRLDVNDLAACAAHFPPELLQTIAARRTKP